MDDAELARSILACPAAVELVVEGLPHAGDDGGLSLLDGDGTPAFSCPEGSLTARAGAETRKALVTLDSGLGPLGGAQRGSRVALAGQLRTRQVEHCECCAETRHTVTLGLDLVVLTRAGTGTPVVVELDDFRQPRLSLNAGHFQRAVEHANGCHQDELRHAVARHTGRPVREVAGVGLTDLSTSGVEVTWLDRSGGNRFRLSFGHVATTPAELGELLRRELHAGIC